jgi:GABA(A) receptor-associated protein
MDEISLQKQKDEVKRIINKFPGRVPILVYKDPRSDIQEVGKNKFLVPRDLKWDNFLLVIRKRITLTPEKGLFIFVNNIMLNSNSGTVGDIYEQYKESSGYLVISYAGESVFG